MNVSICAATPFELAPFQKMMADKFPEPGQAGHQLQYCITGIGMLQSTFHIQAHIQAVQPDFLLQIGIAGCFDPAIPLGSVVAIEREYLGSLGVMEVNNRDSGLGWQDIFDLGLQDASLAPFEQKALINPLIGNCPWFDTTGIRIGTGITIDEITTTPERIKTLLSRFPSKQATMPTLESMEGASLHFTCHQLQRPFLQLRAVSNYVGERDKRKWQIDPAIQAVATAALQVILQV